MADKRAWTVYATIIKVHDGDTFTADLDTGWNTWRMKQRIRVSNMAAPELKLTDPAGPDPDNPAGIAARDAAMKILLVGGVVEITSKALDQYGRTLATVRLSDGSDFGEYMIFMGHGYPIDKTKEHYGGN